MAQPTPPPGRRVDPTLVVLGGMHAGASHALRPGTHELGSGLSCDVVLLDQGVQQHHAQLQVEDGRVAVQRIDQSEVRINDQVMQDERRDLRPGDRLSLGSAVARIDMAHHAASPAQEASPVVKSRRHWILLPVLGFSVVFLGLFVMILGSREKPPVIVAAMRPPSTVAPVPPADAIVQRIREFIGDDRLKVVRAPDGGIVVSGTTTSPTSAKQVQRIRKDYASLIEIRDETSYVNVEQPRHIRMPERIVDVHVGDARWFQTASGARYFEGSEFGEGTQVLRIDMDGIVFRRQGQLTVFRYGKQGSDKHERQ
jgi:hypothetical protein